MGLFMLSYQSLSAEVYQLDKAVGVSFGDVEYYAQRLQGITGKVLEPAVGTGRILIPLLEQGFDIEGFDPSESMLEICQQNLTAHQQATARVFKASLETWQATEQYAAIILPTGSFLLLDDEAKAIQALENCYAALQQGGRLIFDVFFQHNFKVGEHLIRTFQTASNEMISLNITSSEIDYVNQVTTSHHRYDKWNAQGQCVQSEFEVFKLKWFGLSELHRILQQIGFSQITISSDYQYLKAAHNQSEIISFEAVKS